MNNTATSDIGLPDDMSRDDAYVQGIADERERLLNELTQRFESDFARIERERGSRAAWDIADLRLVIRELRERS